MPEMTFDGFATKRFCLLSQNRVNNFVTGDLRGHKHFPIWKLDIGELHESFA